MDSIYKPHQDRVPDYQYQDRLRYILEKGEVVKLTPQECGAITCFGELSPMVFNIENGVPLITERNMGFWRKPVAEIIAFINGARTVDEIELFGCDFWKDYRGKGVKLGLDPNDLGPGSYGPAFHDYPTPYGPLNQFEQVVEQIKKYPQMRTHRVTPWIPFYTARGPNRKVQVAPCHGELHFRVFGDKLAMRMDQRSADFPVGVPSNMIQYAALLLMVAQVTGLKPWRFIHSFADAHIYEDQVDAVVKLTKRPPGPFPVMRVDPSVTNIFDFRVGHFKIDEYHPHPGMKIPYRP